MNDQITFAIQQLQLVLSDVMSAQERLMNECRLFAEVQSFDQAAAMQKTVSGLMMTETILRDKIQNLKRAA